LGEATELDHEEKNQRDAGDRKVATRVVSRLSIGPSAEAYRYNSVSIRVRLIHDDFRDTTRSAREDRVLPVIHTLPDETQEDITILLLLAPNELDRSPMNIEFEHPVPSRI